MIATSLSLLLHDLFAYHHQPDDRPPKKVSECPLNFHCIELTCTTLEKNLSTTPLSFSLHSTVHRSPSTKFSISIQLPNTGRLSKGTFLPEAVAIETIFRVLKVAMIWIFSANDNPVSEGSTSIHTLCSALMD